MDTSLIDDLLSKYSQVVIYGAKGWLGRSALKTLEIKPHHYSSVLLIGSREESVRHTGLPLDVYSAERALDKVRKGSMFFNAAFLRREKIQELGETEFILRNEIISNFPYQLLKRQFISSFINLSSGVAKQEGNNLDIYARLKYESKLHLTKLTSENGSQLVNCQIFTISGEFINEFSNLALSNFIMQALNSTNEIVIKSPNAKRTYIDAVNLSEVLLKLTLDKVDIDIDSGGINVNFLQLAEIIRNSLSPNKKLKLLDEPGADYFGDFEKFNQIAKLKKVELLDLNQQINLTVRAFN